MTLICSHHVSIKSKDTNTPIGTAPEVPNSNRFAWSNTRTTRKEKGKYLFTPRKVFMMEKFVFKGG